jgi:ubiquinol-cytochrome c reductase cytochrome b subunit
MRITVTNPYLSLVNEYLIDSPAPANLNYFWNFGSLLGLNLIIVMVTGISLAMHYNSDVNLAFSSVEHITRDVQYGWLLRFIHMNCVSFFFLCVYIHIGRGLYYSSYKAPRQLLWIVGVVIFILMMAKLISVAKICYSIGVNIDPYAMNPVLGRGIHYTTPTLRGWDLIESTVLCLSAGLPLYPLSFIKPRVNADKRIGPHNHEILSIFCGILLGDAYLNKLNGRYRLRFDQAAEHRDYIHWLFRIIKSHGYANTAPILRHSPLGDQYYFHTYSYTSLGFLYDMFYLNHPLKGVCGIKKVPSNIADYLTPLALAVWVCDDGRVRPYGMTICTNCFT